MQPTVENAVYAPLFLGSSLVQTLIHALSQQAPLVTNNTREFALVPELRLENWVP